MGPAPSRFRHDVQERTMRTVANENDNEKGSTNDPDPKFKGNTGTQDSTKEKASAKTDLPTIVSEDKHVE